MHRSVGDSWEEICNPSWPVSITPGTSAVALREKVPFSLWWVIGHWDDLGWGCLCHLCPPRDSHEDSRATGGQSSSDITWARAGP